MASAADWSAHNVRRIRPPRVLLAMRDRRFMRVTAFLLERRGYAVVQEGGSNVVDAALRSRVDVVVLEGESSRGTSAKTMAALTALPSAPSLISIVDDEAGEGLAGVPAIAKWTSVEELAREIDALSLRR
jgi:CheY-like chemotaxis protein